MHHSGTDHPTEKRVLGFDINNSFVGALLLMVVGLVTATALLIAVFKPAKTIVPKDFEECSRLRGSVIQESYPETCVTKDGVRFTNPNQKVIEEPETPLTWQSYNNTKYNYSLLHPKTWILKESFRPETLSSATFQHMTPAAESSEVTLVAAQINVKTTTRTYSDRERDLKQVLLARSDNFIFSFFDPGKITQLMVEEKLNTMSDMTIAGYQALVGEEIAYIDTGTTIIQITLSSPIETITDNDRSVFRQVVLSFNSDQVLSPTPTSILANDPQTICRKNNGTWLSEYDECEGLDKNICEENDGTYDACESACRNDPNAEVCIQVCVEVCTFK